MSDIITEPAAALADIAVLLESMSLPYFLVGSFASGILGEFRATNDIDLVCKLTTGDTATFVSLAEQNFYTDDVAIGRSIAERRSFNLIHEDTFVKVDIFTRIDAFAESEFERASTVSIPGSEQQVSVSSLEYNILAKLRWYLKSNRQLSMQLRDVRSMIDLNSDRLDLSYLNHWAKSLGLTDELSSLL